MSSGLTLSMTPSDIVGGGDITVTWPSAAGCVTACATCFCWPRPTSAINLSASRRRDANSAVIRGDSLGRLTILNEQPAGTATRVIPDVTNHFR